MQAHDPAQVFPAEGRALVAPPDPVCVPLQELAVEWLRPPGNASACAPEPGRERTHDSEACVVARWESLLCA